MTILERLNNISYRIELIYGSNVSNEIKDKILSEVLLDVNRLRAIVDTLKIGDIDD